MSFISSCIQINYLSSIKVTQPLCLDAFGFFIVVSGDVRATVGQTIYALQAGDVVLTSAREICYFKGSGTLLGFAFESNHLPRCGVFHSSSHCLPFLQTIKTAQGSTLYPLLELLLCYSEEFVPIEPLKNRDIALFQRAIEIMRRRVDTRISVEELADALHISLSHIKRIFAEYAKLGAHDYYNLLKICAAKELLLGGETATRTAELTGFANQAYFSAAFKRITGVSPKAFGGKAPNSRPAPTPKKEKPSQKRDLPDYLL